MPCLSGTEQEWAEFERARGGTALANSEMPAVLCGIFTALEGISSLDLMLDAINWEEAGVRRIDVEAWWSDHKERDADRRAK